MQEGGASLVELGIPYADPQADGATIQHTNQVAIKGGTSQISHCLNLATLARDIGLTIPVVLMGYYNLADSLVFLRQWTDCLEVVDAAGPACEACHHRLILISNLKGEEGEESVSTTVIKGEPGGEQCDHVALQAASASFRYCSRATRGQGTVRMCTAAAGPSSRSLAHTRTYQAIVVKVQPLQGYPCLPSGLGVT